MRVGWRGALGILLSVALLWWVLKDQDLGAIWRVLSESNLALWIATMVFATAIFPLRARRWAALLEPVAGRLPFRSLWQSTAVGMMVNNVVPARAGEFARAFALSRAEPCVKFTAAFGSLAVDRLFDGAIVLLLMVAAMLDPAFGRAGAGGTGTVVVSMRFAALFLAAVLAVLALLVVAPASVYALHDATMGRFAQKLAARTRALLEGFASGLGVLRHPRLVAEVFFWTLLHWLCNAFAFWLGFRALGIAASFSAALLVQGIVAIGVAIPSSPGFFGVFEAGAIVGLALYGVGSTQAISWAIGFHILSYVPITLIGVWYLTRLKLHFRDFRAGGEVTSA
jgi:hypothetical protein